MNILVVCSANSGELSPFVKEQIDSLKKMDVSIDIFGIKGKGKVGYLKNLFPLLKTITKGRYDLIHAHYGLSGLLANLQWKTPVITTFHGSDLGIKSNRKYSKLAGLLSSFSILTNSQQTEYSIFDDENSAVIPCGIDLSLFKPMDSTVCRNELGLKNDTNYILFSSSFDRPEKNAAIAIDAVKSLNNTELIELDGYSRLEVVKLINASRLILITSLRETGPLIAKESWACNTPVVSTDVGDVSSILGKRLAERYIVPFDKKILIGKIKEVCAQPNKIEFRDLVAKYQLSTVALEIKKIYDSLVNK